MLSLLLLLMMMGGRRGNGRRVGGKYGQRQLGWRLGPGAERGRHIWLLMAGVVRIDAAANTRSSITSRCYCWCHSSLLQSAQCQPCSTTTTAC